MESLELFGKEILPEFAERDEQRQREKAARLEPVIEAVMARKPASPTTRRSTPTTRSRRSPAPRPTGPRRRSSTSGSTTSSKQLAAGEDVSKRLA